MKVGKIAFGVLTVVVLSIIGSCQFIFGPALREQHAAFQFAANADEARLAKLIVDCRALTEGRPLVPKPYEGGEYSRMWDERSGYPEEFRDLRPVRIFVSNDSVTIVTFKAFKDSAEIEVTGLQSLGPTIAFKHGDHMSTKTMVLWPKPSHASQPTTGRTPGRG